MEIRDSIIIDGESYVRKDALLEWADKFRHTSLPGKTIIAYLLDKLNQL